MRQKPELVYNILQEAKRLLKLNGWERNTPSRDGICITEAIRMAAIDYGHGIDYEGHYSSDYDNMHGCLSALQNHLKINPLIWKR